MRYAILADIHGNLAALEAVLRACDRRPVDRHLVLGDLVGYGPLPNECIRAVAALDATVVAGNHDLIARRRLPSDDCIAVARRTLAWTAERLDHRSRVYLDGLPRVAHVAGGVVCAHGTLDDPREYLTTAAQAIRDLRALAVSDPDATVLAVGHTHRPWLCTAEGTVRIPTRHDHISLGNSRVVINPGAVGQVRGGPIVARFAILDTDARTVVFTSVPYNVRRTRAALRAAGLPAGTYRLRRSALRRIAGLVRKVRPGA